MFIVYEPGDIVKLRRTYEYDDLDDWGMNSQEELDQLREAEDNGYNAEIRGVATDGYYDITVCADGVYIAFDAICSYHLRPASSDYKLLLDVEGI